MAGEVKEIELWPCRYNARRKVKNCQAMATIIACGMDSIGRPKGQYELCVAHARANCGAGTGQRQEDYPPVNNTVVQLDFTLEDFMSLLIREVHWLELLLDTQQARSTVSSIDMNLAANDVIVALLELRARQLRN